MVPVLVALTNQRESTGAQPSTMTSMKLTQTVSSKPFSWDAKDNSDVSDLIGINIPKVKLPKVGWNGLARCIPAQGRQGMCCNLLPKLGQSPPEVNLNWKIFQLPQELEQGQGTWNPYLWCQVEKISGWQATGQFVGGNLSVSLLMDPAMVYATDPQSNTVWMIALRNNIQILLLLYVNSLVGPLAPSGQAFFRYKSFVYAR